MKKTRIAAIFDQLDKENWLLYTELRR